MGRVARDSGSWGMGRLRGAEAGDMGGGGQRLGRWRPGNGRLEVRRRGLGLGVGVEK